LWRIWPIYNRTWLWENSTEISEELSGNSLTNLTEARTKSKLSFLFESAATTETIGRYSFVGAGRSVASAALELG
jgi:hypothetical protein